MSRRGLSVKGGTSERCYRTRRGWTDEKRYAIISPYFDGRIKMNGPYPEITNILSLAKLFFKTFISLKHLSDYRTFWFLCGYYGSMIITTDLHPLTCGLFFLMYSVDGVPVSRFIVCCIYIFECK